jgi:hypothetical protein
MHRVESRGEQQEKCGHIFRYDKNLQIEGLTEILPVESRTIEVELFKNVVKTLQLCDSYQYNICIYLQNNPNQASVTSQLAKARLAIMNIMTSLLTATRQVASSRSFASDSDYAKMQTSLKELVSSSIAFFRSLQEQFAYIEPSVESKLNSLKESTLPVQEVKANISGVAKVQLSSEGKQKTVGAGISKSISDIPGVVEVWFSGSKSFDILANVKVEEYNEGQKIEDRIKAIQGVKNAKMFLSTDNISGET